MKPAPVGTRVLVTTGYRAGQTGVIKAMRLCLLNDHDVAVLIDGDTFGPTCWLWRELAPETVDRGALESAAISARARGDHDAERAALDALALDDIAQRGDAS